MPKTAWEKGTWMNSFAEAGQELQESGVQELQEFRMEPRISSLQVVSVLSLSAPL
jgi:hypothetical protein